MFGFLIGIASLIGLVKVLRMGRGGCGGRGWHGGGCHGGHGCHGRGGHWHGHHHHHHGGPRGFRGGSRGWMRWLFERLDTSPGQEKEIAAAVDELIGQARTLKEQGKSSRDDVARVFRSESLDENALGELFSRHDDALRELHKAFAGALGRIHNALDAEQRAKLAELIESGPRGFGGFGGPYRGWV